jgi:thioredoxin reductase (NADPH)
MANILVYTKSGCPWCDDVRAYLKETGLPFEEREVRTTPQYFEEMEKLSGQRKAPVVVVDGEVLADTDREAVEAFLRQKGIV